MKNDRIKSDRLKTDRIKSITDPKIYTATFMRSKFIQFKMYTVQYFYGGGKLHPRRRRI
jgi:hypothetical protein